MAFLFLGFNGETKPSLWVNKVEVKVIQKIMINLDNSSPQEVERKFNSLKKLISFLKRIAEKELKGLAITEKEYDEMRWYGSGLERITLSMAEGGEWVSEEDENVALIADVYTNAYTGQVL